MGGDPHETAGDLSGAASAAQGAAEVAPVARRAAAPVRLIEGLRLRVFIAALAPVALMLAVVAGALALRGDASSETVEILHALAFVGLVLLVAAGALAASVGRRLRERVAVPLTRARAAIQKLREGDASARTGVAGNDEIGALGLAIDGAIEQRAFGGERAERDSEALNDSVIEIMQAVGTIASTKDLTLKVPVTEDVTGAIADALNLLTDETRRVLLNVRGVSHDVAQATVAVKSQSDSAAHAAARERREVELAAQELSHAAAALNAIAERARTCNEAADRAVQATGDAVRTVARTVDGIEHSRTLIRETEKRIKRLGERSQEIGQVVGIIQGIAERTGILALNASMQAAGAGEAGRSFAAVADEVKRLSESARDATTQIGRLVTAIQTEASGTVKAMNQAISQVVEISRLAEQAGAGMRRTQDDTEALASDVRDIARTSAEQARVGAALIERARIIEEASGETEHQLSLQAAETQRLVECAKALLDEVGVFRVGEP